jgi:hypothetical protein
VVLILSIALHLRNKLTVQYGPRARGTHRSTNLYYQLSLTLSSSSPVSRVETGEEEDKVNKRDPEQE